MAKESSFEGNSLERKSAEYDEISRIEMMQRERKEVKGKERFSIVIDLVERWKGR